MTSVARRIDDWWAVIGIRDSGFKKIRILLLFLIERRKKVKN